MFNDPEETYSLKEKLVVAAVLNHPVGLRGRPLIEDDGRGMVWC